MTIQRQAAADLLLTAAIVSVGFVTGQPVLAAIVGGIGVNWASNLTQAAWKRACGQWLGPDGMGNHDLQNALNRAFGQAFDRLEQAWQQTPAAARCAVRLLRQRRSRASLPCCAPTPPAFASLTA
jgi:hypothetical protein